VTAHYAYVERWEVGLWVVMCSQGDCRRSDAPTVLGTFLDEGQARAAGKRHQAETAAEEAK
jgi:hypothetical protein